MKTLFIWTLGITAGVVLLISVVAIAPKVKWSPDYEYNWTSLNPSTMAGTIMKMKNEGWVIDDYNADSCGNAYLILKKRKGT